MLCQSQRHVIAAECTRLHPVLTCFEGMVDFTGTGLRSADCGCGLRIADCGLRIADCEPMQIVYFFGKKATRIACSYL